MMLSSRVVLVLDTYEDWRESPGPVIEWLELVRRDLTDPLAASIAAAGQRLDPRLIARLRDSDRLTRRKYSDATWAAMIRRLEGGELDTLWIEYAPDLKFEVEADLDPITGRRCSVIFECGQWPDALTLEVQEALVVALRQGAQLLRASTGYITEDVFPCPYEAVMGCEMENWERYDEQLRGYYWGNILSEYHITKLGGIHALLSEAPFLVRDDISTATQQLVYLQSTGRLFNWPLEAVAAARNYLVPLLPGGTPDPENASKAIHVLEDASIPERSPVPGTRYWRWLEGVRKRTGIRPPAIDLDALQAEADALSPGPRSPISQESTAEVFLDSLEVTLVLDYLPAAGVRADLIRLVEVWAAQGIEFGFGDGVMHSVDRPSFGETDGGTVLFGFLADLGSAGEAAFNALYERLERFVGARELAVKRLVVGHGGLDL